MQLNEYQFEAVKTSTSDDEDRLVEAALGIAGETGECVDALKKMIFHGHDMKEKLKLELGDVLWYVAVLASSLGFTLDEIGQANIDKLRKRYGDKYSQQASVERADVACGESSKPIFAFDDDVVKI